MKTKTCPDCNGDGVIGKGTDDEQQCPTCGGSGFVPDDDNDEEVTRTKVHMATTSNARGLTVPSTLLARAEEAIELSLSSSARASNSTMAAIITAAL